MPRTGEGEQQTRNKTKTKRHKFIHAMHPTRAQLRRARYSCAHRGNSRRENFADLS